VKIRSCSKRQKRVMADLAKDLPVAVTMGCPAGIGPEVILKALKDDTLCQPVVVIGDSSILKAVADAAGIHNVNVRKWKPGHEVRINKEVVYCLDVTNLSPQDIKPGLPTKTTGLATYEYIARAVELCQSGLACGIATAPISKTGLKLANIQYPGHTEILANLTGTKHYLMMMAGPRLKVTLATIHVPLRQVPELLNMKGLCNTIRLTNKSLMQDFGLDSPVIGVCGLNPHAGEGGMFGHEEEQIIAPACDKIRQEGIKVHGPLPPDTAFYYASLGKYDALVCQYHDQGLIPFKLLHFRDGVNVTCGLPIVRTSVDHGTGYDIAWQGKAHHHSMKAAIELARLIYDNRWAGKKS